MASDRSGDGGSGTETTADDSRPSVLVVYGPTNPSKIERHVGPLAEVADTDIVCFGQADPVEGIDYLTVPTFGVRLVGLLFLVVRAVLEAVRGDYDAVVSFSLFPHGLGALLGGRLSGTPVHLGVLGIDLDHHAESRYAPVVAWLFRRFDAVSVPGTAHEARLHRLGVAPGRTAVLANAIDVEQFTPGPADGRGYDFLWLGRVDHEKNPLAFVEAVGRLRDEGRTFRAAMVGDGPLMDAVRRRVDALDLHDYLDLEGWVDGTVPYYRRADAFVLTSHRDALPLSLVESMACGVVPVAPRVGNVGDVVTEENGLLVEEPTPDAIAAAMGRLLDDPDLRESLATDGSAVRDAYSYEAASDDWREILDILTGESPETTASNQPVGA